jgi:hypothetical protein
MSVIGIKVRRDVALRTARLASAEDRELVWFLQWQSHQPGGLKAFAAEVLKRFADLIGPETLRSAGVKPSQQCTRAQVEAIREEMPGHYPLRGEIEEPDDISAFLPPKKHAEAEALRHPSSYPAAVFFERSRAAALVGLEGDLKELALDPKQAVADGKPWYFPRLVSSIRQLMAERAEAQAGASVVTAIGQRIHESIDYARETSGLVVLIGQHQTGKTESAKDWCARYPGRARHVELDSESDELSFHRTLAKALGVACALSMKAQQIRDRVQEMLQGGDLVLVLDSAHYLWPSTIDYRALPVRVNWVISALTNHGVPVVLIAGPQFLANQKAMEERTRWTSDELSGRINHFEQLPGQLNEADLAAVARKLAGVEDDKIAAALASLAVNSKQYLGAIKTAVDRAGFIARKAGRAGFTRADLALALKTA